VTLTVIDPRPALVLVDLQKGITATTRHSMPEVVARAAELASAFRSRGLPVVLVNVSGGGAHGRTDAQQAGKPGRVRAEGWTELAAELDPQPGDHRVTKTTWGAFHGTGLHAYLQEHGVTQVVLGGVATSIGVESTARSLYDAGYNVSFAVDAMADRVADNHRHSVATVFPRLGESGSTDDVLRLLNAR